MRWIVLCSVTMSLATPAFAAAVRPAEQFVSGQAPMLENSIDRPLRYFPENGDFVITNGVEFFNRPLYAANAPFRIDGGDRPEFSLYMGGRGGNLRLGLGSGTNASWLHTAQTIVTRYRPGSLIYDFPAESGNLLRMTILPLMQERGLIVRIEPGPAFPAGSDFIVAFGGMNGMRGRRNGDIGCETLPVSEFFQLRPDQCRDNSITPGPGGFLIRGRPGALMGCLPSAEAKIANADHWQSLPYLLRSADDSGEAFSNRLAILRVKSASKHPFHFILRQVDTNASGQIVFDLTTGNELARRFDAAERQRRTIAEQLIVETPDPFVNAAVAALNVAANGVWDERQQAFMHGAVAWRNRLLGWRGIYSGDALGWHERTRNHFTGFARQQNMNPIPEEIPVPEASANLSRNENALHSNGNMTRSHYDMNLIAVDAFFRHLLWTGDLEFAREWWPTIERHLAWERRLFRREFGPDKLPLYEAYAAIWASDDLAYNGGGSTHGSAYNYFHNTMAARVARLLGKDAAPYEAEARSIAEGMRRELWLKDRGWFAEWKDLLGEQLTHPEPAVWTFYHTLDSSVPDPLEAWQMTRFIDAQLARIPIRGPNVPPGNFTLPTTRWMPYTWSLNNVVMAEAQHTALACWQAGRIETAFPLFKGAILDSMFLGLCPGNVGMASFFDAHRRESQRDFADGVGSLSRTVVQGLFGIQPDLLAGELMLRPGFPPDWKQARIQHSDLSYSFRREGLTETHSVETHFPRAVTLRLQIPAYRDRIESITVNGADARWRIIESSVGTPRIEIEAPENRNQNVIVHWAGAAPAKAAVRPVVARNSALEADCGARILEVRDPQGAISHLQTNGGSLRAIASGPMGHRTFFAKVESGNLRWWQPVEFEIRPPWELIGSPSQGSPTELRFKLRNNTAESIDREVAIHAGSQVVRRPLSVSAFGDSPEISIPAEGLLPGANPVGVSIRDGLSVSNVVTHWKIQGSKAAFETCVLDSLFNDSVSRIFQNEYLAPRSPHCSLAMPKQGIGSWCHPADQFEIDDGGLRKLAAAAEGKIVLPQGIPFATPSDAEKRNILFTSQWNHFPVSTSVPLGGKARHVYLLMAGSTQAMQSRFDNGEVVVTYQDGSTARLALRNPENWWPIDQDYFIDDFAFRRPEAIPPRVNLKSGEIRILDPIEFKGRGRSVPGGAATVLDLPLDPNRELKTLTLRAIANEVVIGVMSVTLAR